MRPIDPGVRAKEAGGEITFGGGIDTQSAVTFRSIDIERSSRRIGIGVIIDINRSQNRILSAENFFVESLSEQEP